MIPPLEAFGEINVLASPSTTRSSSTGWRATAFPLFNGEIAFAFYQSARQYGRKIPADVSATGCDNAPFSTVMEVPLSTIHVPTVEMGREMAQRLITCIKRKTPGKREKHVLEPALMPRGSVPR